MQYKDHEFVEFLRRVLDFPRRGLLNPSNPDFAEVLLAPAAHQTGSTVDLKPEVYYFGTPNWDTKPSPKAPRFAPGRSTAPYIPPANWKRTQNNYTIGGQPSSSAKTLKPVDARVPGTQANITPVYLGPEKNPIDGTAPWLAGSPFSPNQKLNPGDCCYC